MSDIVLHHFPASPYAEKIRAILGFKKLKWKSVTIPAVMPKPDVVALTGGYRRTPVLQIGADVYCDSGLIARAIEDYAPSPTLFTYGDTLAMEAITFLSEAVLFNTAVPIAFTPASVKVFFPDATPEFLDSFRTDRAAMRKGGTARRGPIDECRAKAMLNPFPKTYLYMDRMAALGHGKPTEITSGKALEIAKASKPARLGYGLAIETEGIKLGDTVEVLPVDYAFDPVKGELLTASADEIVVRRTDPRAGTLQVHFPRFGYEIRKHS